MSHHHTVQFFGDVGNAQFDPMCRIDAFCVISVGDEMRIGRMSHIGAGSKIFGGRGRVIISDYTGLSPNVTFYTGCDDFTDGSVIGPGYPDEFRNVKTGNVILEPFSVVGTNCVVLPGVRIGRFARIGAGSIVTRDVPPFEYWDSRSGRFKKRFGIPMDKAIDTINKVEAHLGEAREWA